MTQATATPEAFTWDGTVAEAIERADYLGQEYGKIEAQLGVRRPTERVTNAEYDAYREWRRRAIYAKQQIYGERARLSEWIKQHRTELEKVRPDSTSIKQEVARSLDELGVDYTLDQLNNLRRRIGAELTIGRFQLLVLDLIEMFREHDEPQDGEECPACDLLDQAEDAAL